MKIKIDTRRRYRIVKIYPQGKERYIIQSRKWYSPFWASEYDPYWCTKIVCGSAEEAVIRAKTIALSRHTGVVATNLGRLP